MAKYKTIYILVEDGRETGLLRGNGCTGTICYSLEEACIALLKRQWFYEPEQRKWIEEMREKHGPIKAYHNHTCSAWIYCPTYVRKRIKI